MVSPHPNNPPSAIAARNQLAGETSPYLLQHAANPVHWQPWGNAALERARSENKSIFLSIGYSSCHWCHVMAHESFEDTETADILNAHFVSIKVDREERPDIDAIYMQAVQMMTGSGGWPLSVFLTPDGKPFYGGTYYPPHPRYGIPSFRQVLAGVAKAWKDNPEEIATQAGGLSQAIAKDLANASSASTAPLGAEVLDHAVEQLKDRFDAQWGGFSPAPKFPNEGAIAILLRHAARSGDAEAAAIAERTLDAMAYGGICDQAGGGFHRYATDREWLTPHFEKMLYDNALLAATYTEAWQATKKPLYQRVVLGTLDYLLRDMTDPSGGFHSAEDADSEGEEGRFYIWTPAEISKAVGTDDADLAIAYFGATDTGNFEGRNILHVPQPPEAFARAHNTKPDDLEHKISQWSEALLQTREKRIRPGRDDKVLAAWNGMAISALSRAGTAFGEPRYLDAARAATEFVLKDMMRDGQLVRSWRRRQAGGPAFLDDYAHMSLALLDLYEATLDAHWLGAAESLAEVMVENFADPDAPGFFYAGRAHEKLIARSKPAYDGPTPSGNSAAAMALLRLGRTLDRDDLRRRAEDIFRAFRADISRAPVAFLDMLTALDHHLHPGPEIVIAGEPDAAREMAHTAAERFLPNRLIAAVPEDNIAAAQGAAPGKPLTEGRTAPHSGARAWVCHDFACQAPVDTTDALAKALDKNSPTGVWLERDER